MDTVRRRWERLYPHIEAVGPDDTYVNPHVCVSGRMCFCAPPGSDGRRAEGPPA